MRELYLDMKRKGFWEWSSTILDMRVILYRKEYNPSMLYMILCVILYYNIAFIISEGVKDKWSFLLQNNISNIIKKYHRNRRQKYRNINSNVPVCRVYFYIFTGLVPPSSLVFFMWREDAFTNPLLIVFR